MYTYIYINQTHKASKGNQWAIDKPNTDNGFNSERQTNNFDSRYKQHFQLKMQTKVLTQNTDNNFNSNYRQPVLTQNTDNSFNSKYRQQF